MSGAARLLEIYDPGDVAGDGGLSPNAILKKACDAAYRQGYCDGGKASRTAREEEISALLAAAKEATADFAVSHTEARKAVIASLAPLVRAMTDAVLPACAGMGLAEELAAAAARLAAGTNAPRLRISLAPEHADTVAAILEERGVAAEVRADPEVAGISARLGIGEAGEIFDADAAIGRLRRCADAFFQATEQEDRHAG
ncbi:MAG: hypothetical protein ACE5FS_13450 [Paracoccaceae bacterium]